MNMPGDLLKMFDEIQNLDYGTRFYKADLHFHTPASSDGRGRDKYGFNPYGIPYPARKKIANSPDRTTMPICLFKVFCFSNATYHQQRHENQQARCT